MEQRLRACVRLHATDAGDFVFAYSVEPVPGRGYSPMFAISMPMDEASGFREDVERLFGAYAKGEPVGDVYGMEMTAAMTGTVVGERPLAVAYMEDMVDYALSPKTVGIECIDERWEYYCKED